MVAGRSSTPPARAPLTSRDCVLSWSSGRVAAVCRSWVKLAGATLEEALAVARPSRTRTPPQPDSSVATLKTTSQKTSRLKEHKAVTSCMHSYTFESKQQAGTWVDSGTLSQYYRRGHRCSYAINMPKLCRMEETASGYISSSYLSKIFEGRLKNSSHSFAVDRTRD